MRPRRSPSLRFRPTLPFVLLSILLAVLWLAGGASRADAPGQMAVRAASAILLIVALLAGPRPNWGGARPVLLLILAALALALLQLVPLPPALWQALPGRAMLAEAAAASGQPQPWRPWSIVPGATVNAAASLIVPLAVAILAAGLTEDERKRLPGTLLVLVLGATLIGLLQFSGAGFDNPLVNDTPGEVSATLANRNHFALLLALGCLVAPVWAFPDDGRPHWRAPAAIALVILFALTILATGSRAGLALGGIGLVLGLVTVRRAIRRTLRRYPRWVLPAAAAGLVGLIAILVLASVGAGRAVSIDRVLTSDLGEDMRKRGLPTVLAMIRLYFPAGSGLGGFDPVFRMHEPFALLKPTYFNHAHNDWLEIVLDAGLPGLVLMAAGLGWWGWAGVGAWRTAGDTLRRLGWSALFLVLVASAFDYPARTPMVMAVMAIAGLWLAGERGARASALPVID